MSPSEARSVAGDVSTAELHTTINAITSPNWPVDRMDLQFVAAAEVLLDERDRHREVLRQARAA